jgi:hypothetical protein
LVEKRISNIETFRFAKVHTCGDFVVSLNGTAIYSSRSRKSEKREDEEGHARSDANF